MLTNELHIKDVIVIFSTFPIIRRNLNKTMIRGIICLVSLEIMWLAVSGGENYSIGHIEYFSSKIFPVREENYSM